MAHRRRGCRGRRSAAPGMRRRTTSRSQRPVAPPATSRKPNPSSTSRMHECPMFPSTFPPRRRTRGVASPRLSALDARTSSHQHDGTDSEITVNIATGSQRYGDSLPRLMNKPNTTNGKPHTAASPFAVRLPPNQRAHWSRSTPSGSLPARSARRYSVIRSTEPNLRWMRWSATAVRVDPNTHATPTGSASRAALSEGSRRRMRPRYPSHPTPMVAARTIRGSRNHLVIR